MSNRFPTLAETLTDTSEEITKRTDDLGAQLERINAALTDVLAENERLREYAAELTQRLIALQDADRQTIERLRAQLAAVTALNNENVEKLKRRHSQASR